MVYRGLSQLLECGYFGFMAALLRPSTRVKRKRNVEQTYTLNYLILFRSHQRYKIHLKPSLDHMNVFCVLVVFIAVCGMFILFYFYLGTACVSLRKRSADYPSWEQAYKEV